MKRLLYVLCLTLMLPLLALGEAADAPVLYLDRQMTQPAPATLSLPVGGHQMLYAVQAGRVLRDAQWSSSAPEIVTCEAGRMEALLCGSAEITCTLPTTTLHVTVTVYQPVTSVALPRGLMLYAGDTADAAATVLPDGATDPSVDYAVDDASVMVVDEQGTLYALRAGTAKLTATARDGSGRSATVRVKVSALPTAVTVTPAAYTGDLGDSFRLRAAVIPDEAADKAVTWHSSDEAVAVVNESGAVTLTGRGQATITALSTVSAEAMGSCAVTVTQPVTDITITGYDAPLIAGETVSLSADVLPEDADQRGVTWVSRNIHVATVDDSGRVTALKPGSADIVAEAADGSGAKGKVKVVVAEAAAQILLDQTEVTLSVGETLTLSGAVTPKTAVNRALTWHVEPEDVLLLDASDNTVTLTGRTWGDAVVTASTLRGSVTATCAVHVGSGTDALLVTPSVVDGQPRVTLLNVSDSAVTSVTLAMRGYSAKDELLMLGTGGDPTLLLRADVSLDPGAEASLTLDDLTLLTPLRSWDGLTRLKVSVTAFTTAASTVTVTDAVWFDTQS